MTKEHEYSPADLTRALIRQYLNYKGLKATLVAFERQQPNNKKKITKSLLIELTSMKNLCQIHKHIQGQETLLQILVTYLNKKYQSKNGIFQRTEPQFYPHVNLEPHRKANKVLEATKFGKDKAYGKQRPVSSKSAKINIKAPQTYQRSDLKVIYDKLSRVQSKPRQVQQKRQSKFILKDIDPFPRQQNKIQTKLPSSIPNIQPVEIEEEQEQYKDQFQMSLPEHTNKQIDPQLPQIKNQLLSKQNIITQTNKNISSEIPKVQQNHIISLHQDKKNLCEYQFKEDNHQSETDQKVLINQISPKAQDNISIIKKKAADEIINIVPIVNSLTKQQQQNKPGHILQNNIIEKPMGCIETPKADQTGPQPFKIDVNVQSSYVAVKVHIHQQPQKQQPIQKQFQSLNKPRTQMRLLGKNNNSNKVAFETKQINYGEQKSQLPPSTEKMQKIGPGTQKEGEQLTEHKQPIMVTIGKKKKLIEGKNMDGVQQYPTKFKFDENFTHGIPIEVDYEYESYGINCFKLDQNIKEKHQSLILETNINYRVKGGGVSLFKKKQQKTISSIDASKLKIVVFQSGPSVLPKQWNQGFILSPFDNTPYGLKQIEGGPCGIIAAVQCYYLKHLLYLAKQPNQKNDIVRQMSLVGAIADLLWKVRSSEKITLAFPPKGATKIDLNNLRVVTFDATQFNSVFSAVWAYRDDYIGDKNFGVAALLYSAVLTKGPEKIQEQVDIKSNPLIGNHGHCTQEFVNMVLTGKACSNVFDGEKIIDDYKIRGIPKQSEFGFLTVFETLRYIEVGKNLKNPVIPAWIICKQFHYHVVFAGHYLIAENNKTPKFDIVYFDGLYNCGDRIKLTLFPLQPEQKDQLKIKQLPLIQQVLLTKWGPKKADWNGSTKIL